MNDNVLESAGHTEQNVKISKVDAGKCPEISSVPIPLIRTEFYVYLYRVKPMAGYDIIIF